MFRLSARRPSATIKHAMDLFHAENDRIPKTYDEFMTEIIKANNIALPQLPPYQNTATTRRSTSSSSWNTQTSRISQAARCSCPDSGRDCRAVCSRCAYHEQSDW